MRFLKIILPLLTLAAILLTACGGQGEMPGQLPETPPPLAEAMSRMYKPEHAPEPILHPEAELAAELAGLWIKIDGSTATIPLSAALFGYLGDDSWAPVHQTTPEAYRYLIHGDADLIFVTYPSANEFAMAQEAGIEMEIIPIVKDALVFLINIENPVDNVSLAQLRDIYTGKITNWQKLGGIDEGIIPYQRTVDSGSQTLFLKLLMDGTIPMDAPTEWRPESMGALVETVSNYDNSRKAIGYSVFYYVNNMYGNSRFKLLGIDGVKPSRDSISCGEYALEDHYYAVMRQNTPVNSPARKLVAWLLTEEGQSLAARAGYIPLRPLEDIWPADIDPIYLGETESSSGTGGSALKSGLKDVVTGGLRMPLSDIFFDGFNYIQYINGKIFEELQNVSQYGWQITQEESVSIRPFSGIPNDYPNYEVAGSGDLHYIIINFPQGNPFFIRQHIFNIPLTADISPYGIGIGDYSVTYHYARRMLPYADLYTLTVDIPASPDITAFINKQLKTWSDGFPGGKEKVNLIEGFHKVFSIYTDDGYYICSLQPSSGRWGDYLTITYVLSAYGGYMGNMPMLYTICFDMNTGRAVNLVDVLPGNLDYSIGSVFPQRKPAKDGDFEYINYDSDIGIGIGYTPDAGSIITDAWFMGGGLNIYVTEPDGHRLQFIFEDVFIED
jgi:phosphate transport system substrate-binding protein